ncbi:hypothetical protein GCM10023185_07300 [Hymenobacter saemangeumensis]|uniref:Threonine/serine exporter family protein n=1 Tax=Hymenobacter saemangeumensis TaxID=1084522 RepID=A0ABP8I2H8_9BACT
MRLITVRTPAGEGKEVVKIALAQGIGEAVVSMATLHRAGEGEVSQDVVDLATATPLAKQFIEALLEAPFYNPTTFSFTIRHPESLFGSKPPKDEAHPIARPTTDVYQELYQFIKVTYSLAGRVFISAVLLAYGMVENFLPIIIAGLLFLPFHHHLLGIALGGVTKEWRFLGQAALALVVSTLLIFLAGICVALVCEPPMLFELKGSMLAGIVLAAVIGVAAALASIDDAGRRELIGLAATAHISIYPAWIGLQLVYGEADSHKIVEHLVSFLINVGVLSGAAFLTYTLTGMKGSGIRRFIKGLAA